MTGAHPFAGKYRHAPLFLGRARRAAAITTADDLAAPYDRDFPYFQPACKALGFARVRLHDLRYMFATLALSAGEHYMQVSKWLGHSSFVLTLTTYAEYIREEGAFKCVAIERPSLD